MEDDRTRGKVGDATRQRIANLAPGWKVSGQPPQNPRPDGEEGGAPPRLRAAAGSKPAPFAHQPFVAGATGTGDGVAYDPRLDPTPGDRVDARAATEPGRDDVRTVPLAESSADLAPLLRTRGVAAIREVSSLPRVPGLVGDIRYVGTVIAGAARARRELALLEPSVVAERAQRSDALVELAATAIGDDEFVHPAVVAAREQLAEIEERRAQHAGVTAAAEEEIAAVRRDHAAEDARRRADITALEAELARVTERLGPLARDLTTARRSAADLKATLAHLDAKIAAFELRAANKPRSDAGAELAALQSERVAVAGDEPVLAVELDALTPRVASLEASRDDLQALLARARSEHRDASRRSDEIIAALVARKVVEDRAVADGEADRRRALQGLGERLHADRPDELRFELAGIDDRDLALAQKQRRVMELREILSSIDRAALARGLFVVLVAIASVIAAIALAV